MGSTESIPEHVYEYSTTAPHLLSITLIYCVHLQSTILEQVRAAISLGNDDPAKEAAMEDVRTATNNWVAKYRRAGVTGRPSYGCILVLSWAVNVTSLLLPVISCNALQVMAMVSCACCAGIPTLL